MVARGYAGTRSNYYLEHIMIYSFTYASNFLSNFYQHPICYEDFVYPSNEHAYQAAKTLDENKRLIIAQATNPGGAKRLGRKLELRKDWEDIKLTVMSDICYQKFEDPAMLWRLLGTGDDILVEGNTWGDWYWGAVKNGDWYDEDFIFNNGPLYAWNLTGPDAGDTYVGSNHLGILLMDIRKELQDKVSG